MKKKMFALVMAGMLATGSFTVVANPAGPGNSQSGAGIEFTAGLQDGVYNPDPENPDLPPGTVPDDPAGPHGDWGLTSINIDFGSHTNPVVAPFSSTDRSGATVPLTVSGGRVRYPSVDFARDYNVDPNQNPSDHATDPGQNSSFDRDATTADIFVVAMQPDITDWHVTVAVGGFTVGSDATLRNFELHFETEAARLRSQDLAPTVGRLEGTGYVQVIPTSGATAAGGILLTAASTANNDTVAGRGTPRPILVGNGRGIFGASFDGILGVVPGSVTNLGDAQAELLWTFMGTAPTA